MDKNNVRKAGFNIVLIEINYRYYSPLSTQFSIVAAPLLAGRSIQSETNSKTCLPNQRRLQLPIFLLPRNFYLTKNHDENLVIPKVSSKAPNIKIIIIKNLAKSDPFKLPKSLGSLER